MYTLPPNNAIAPLFADQATDARRSAVRRDLELQLQNFYNSQLVQPVKGSPGRGVTRSK